MSSALRAGRQSRYCQPDVPIQSIPLGYPAHTGLDGMITGYLAVAVTHFSTEEGVLMSLSDDDITSTTGPGTGEGPADGGANPGGHDGGADGSAGEGPADGGANPDGHDGGADGSAS